MFVALPIAENAVSHLDETFHLLVNHVRDNHRRDFIAVFFLYRRDGFDEIRVFFIQSVYK